MLGVLQEIPVEQPQQSGSDDEHKDGSNGSPSVSPDSSQSGRDGKRSGSEKDGDSN